MPSSQSAACCGYERVRHDHCFDLIVLGQCVVRHHAWSCRLHCWLVSEVQGVLQEMTSQTPRISESLQHLAVDIDSLVHDPANARKHGERNIAAIKASLARFGQVKPVVVADNGVTVIAGNGTLQAARELGWKKIAAVTTTLEGSEATAYAIADNKTAELAEWDNSVLSQLIDTLPGELQEVIGFAETEVERLVESSLVDDKPKEVDVDAISLDHKCPRCGFEFDSP